MLVVSNSFFKNWVLTCLSLICIACSDSEIRERDSFFVKGNARLNTGEYQEALRYYNEAIRLDSTFADAYNNRGIAYAEQAKYGRAVIDYTQAINLKQGFADAFYNRANAYLQLQDYEKSLADLDSVEQYYPDSAYVFFTKGFTLAEVRSYQEAIRAMNQAIALDSTNAEAFVNRGTIYYYQQMYDSADQDIKRALMLNSKEANAYNLQGLVATEMDNFSQALDAFNQALDLTPFQPFFLNNRAKYGFDGHTCSVLISIDEQSTDIAMGVDKALEDINRSIQLDPSNSYAYRNKGIYNLAEDNLASAISNLEQAMDMNENTDKVQYFLAKAYLQAGDKKKACEYLYQASLQSVEDATTLYESQCL